jgi:uncharacterized protein YbaP (TraB family)
MALILRAALILALLFGFGAPAAAAPPIWVVRDADSTIVIFGSVHVLPKGLKWRPKPLDQAMASADDIWFEIPMDAFAASEGAAEAARLALLPPGQTLTPMLDPVSRDRMVKLAAAFKIPMAELEQLRPWMAEVRLSLAALDNHRGLIAEGVEQQVNADTPRTAIRRAFETPAQQIGILAGDDLDTQLTSLKETLKELDQDPNAYDRLVAAWLKGDTQTLVKEVIEPMQAATPKSYRSLVVNRNRAWVDAIKKRLAGSGNTVMVVGAGHLIGPDSVPALLRAQGIAVEGP